MMHWLSKQTTSIYFYLKTIIANQQKKKKTQKIINGSRSMFYHIFNGKHYFH